MATTNGIKARQVIKNKKTTANRDFKIVADEDTGDLCISIDRYQFQKSIILSLDELPERYQTFFAKYVLCK